MKRIPLDVALCIWAVAFTLSVAVVCLFVVFGCSTAHRERVEAWMVEQHYPCMYEHTWLGGNYDECMDAYDSAPLISNISAP
jgi:hypothetical protein